MNSKNIVSYKEWEGGRRILQAESQKQTQTRQLLKKIFNGKINAIFGVWEDEVWASTTVPRTLSGPWKCREKQTISVAVHNNQHGGSQAVYSI